MRVLSFLVLSFLFHSSCFAYIVVLKSGKRLVGNLLGEDATTLQLKDPSGIVLSFKKSLLNEDAMSIANANTAAEEMQADQKTQTKPDVRVYKNEDVNQMPELSILESDSTESPYPEFKEEDAPGMRADPKVERSWRSRAVALQKELSRLREKKIQVEASCEQSRQNANAQLTTPQKKPVNILALLDRSTACKMLDEIAHQLEDAEERWIDFETEARRAEVPWQWLD